MYLKVRDKTRQTTIDENGIEHIPVVWIESDKDVSLGSIKKPNEDIFEIKLEPLGSRDNKSAEVFKGFFKGLGGD